MVVEPMESLQGGERAVLLTWLKRHFESTATASPSLSEEHSTTVRVKNDALLKQLVYEGDEHVRIGVARNPMVSADLIESLAHDKDKSVRRFAASNPSAPVCLLESFVHDWDNWDFELLKGVASNPSAPVDLLRELRGLDSSHYASMYDSSRWIAVLKAICGNPSTPIDILKDFMRIDDGFYLSFVAGNPSTPTDTLKHISEIRGRSFATSLALAMNPSTPAEVLCKLACEKGEFRNDIENLSGWVAKNPSTPPKALRELACDERALISVASNPSTPIDTLNELAQRYDLVYKPGRRVRVSIAKNPSLTIETLRLLLRDSRGKVSSAWRLSTPIGVLRQLKINNRNAILDDLSVGFASNPAMSAETLRIVSDDRRLAVRSGIASNPSAPADILLRLVRDDDNNVRSCAAANPSLLG